MSLECGSIHQQKLLCRSSLPQRRLGSSRRPLQAFAESLEFDRGPEELRPAEDLRAVCCIPIFNAVTGHRAVSVCVCMVDQVKPKLGSCFQVHWRARHVYLEKQTGKAVIKAPNTRALPAFSDSGICVVTKAIHRRDAGQPRPGAGVVCAMCRPHVKVYELGLVYGPEALNHFDAGQRLRWADEVDISSTVPKLIPFSRVKLGCEV